MNLRQAIVLSSVAVAAIIIGAVAVTHRQAEHLVVVERPQQPTPTPVSTVAEPTAPAEIAAAEIHRSVQPVKADMTTVSKPGKKVPAQTGPAAKVKEPVQDPAARVALGLVGVDPEAEQYWLAAINDMRLPANERKDLIEDLNEDGLSDPHHPGPQDVPLILNRLQFIEDLAPYAMDQVNREAFREAYKDLAGMLAGQPAQ